MVSAWEEQQCARDEQLKRARRKGLPPPPEQDRPLRPVRAHVLRVPVPRAR